VTATAALFLALGGASYAAIELPSHSVGERQLRRGAVSPGALSFPLGTASFTRENPRLGKACATVSRALRENLPRHVRGRFWDRTTESRSAYISDPPAVCSFRWFSGL